MLRRRIILTVLFVMAVSVCCSTIYAQSQPTCCPRTVGVKAETHYVDSEENPMPSAFVLQSAIESPLHKMELGDCPIQIDILDIQGMYELSKLIDAIGAVTGVQPDGIDPIMNFDYLLVGVANWDDASKVATLDLSLVDHHHGQVVREARAVCTDPELGEVQELASEMVRSRFSPLDDIIHEYERTPQTAQLQPNIDPT